MQGLLQQLPCGAGGRPVGSLRARSGWGFWTFNYLESHLKVMSYFLSIFGYFRVWWPVILGRLAFQAELQSELRRRFEMDDAALLHGALVSGTTKNNDVDGGHLSVQK